jgi:predicted metal-dependent hydrolase
LQDDDIDFNPNSDCSAAKMIDFEYQIRKTTRRKTISITVYQDNRVLVAAPASMPQNSILQFVEKKSDWVRKNLGRNLQKPKNIPVPLRFVDGEEILYLGEKCTLRIEEGSPSGVFLTNGNIIVRAHRDTAEENRSETIREQLVKWYVSRAKDKIEERIRFYAARIGAMPQSVTIKKMKCRWGSCSSKGRINLAWNIIMAPEPILDYLMVHELCHLKHHDHSADYWRLVESILPDHRERRKWLRVNGDFLSF